MENRNGLLIGVDLSHATGTSELDGALRLIDDIYLGKDCTLGADKGYDTQEFVAALNGGRFGCLLLTTWYASAVWSNGGGLRRPDARPAPSSQPDQ